MGSAIVLGDHLDVLVPVASLELVFDAEVWKVDVPVEVGQVVFARPLFDLARIAIGTAVTIRTAAVRRLRPFLVFTLEVAIEDDAANAGSLLAQPFVLSHVGAIELCVVG